MIAPLLLLAALPLSGASESTNHALAIGFSSRHLVAGARHVAVAVSELQQGEQDLNGDGDTLDLVAWLLDVQTGEWTNLGLAVAFDESPFVQAAKPSPMAFGDGFLVVYGWETEQGADVDGDGDATDPLLHHVDLETGHLTSFALGELSHGRVGGDYAVVAGEEFDTDWDGNGVVGDELFHVLDRRGRLRTVVAPIEPVEMIGDLLLVEKPEGSLAGTDPAGLLNPTPNALLDLRTGRFFTSFHTLTFSDDWIHFTAPLDDFEDFEGSFAWHRPTGRVFDLPEGTASFPMGRHLVVVRDETVLQVDLNRDGDSWDTLWSALDSVDGGLVELDLHSSALWSERDDRSCAAVVWESFVGDDLNGDGDENDWLLHVVRSEPLEIVDLGAVAVGADPHPRASDYFLPIQEGAVDVNGDGDTDDLGPLAYSVSDGEAHTLPISIAGAPLHHRGGYAFLVHEADEGGLDLNGNGQATDRIAHLYRVGLEDPVATPHAVLETNFGFVTVRSRAFYTASEFFASEDWNGDGDLFDVVLHEVELPIPD